MIWWLLLLFVAGMVLILAEFLIPGGICGAVGGLCIVGSCAIAWFAYNVYFPWIAMAEFFGVIIGVGVGIYLIPRTSFGQVITHRQTQDPSEGWVATESDSTLVGLEAEVFTALRPAGTIMVDGRRVDAVSNGELIDKGKRVKVLEVHGSRVVVEEVQSTRESGAV